MSATKTKSRKASATKAAPKKATPAKAKASKPVEVVADPQSERGEAISAGMKELADVRTAAREKRNGVPAKQLIFTAWLKDVAGFNVDAVAKKFPEVKASTIRAWTSYWRTNGGSGSGYPANARNKEKEIKAALKKAAVA